MLWKYLIGAGLAASMMGVSGTAQAGTADGLLKRLHDKGILSDSEYAELLKEEAAPAAAPAPAAATVVDSGKFVRTTDSGIGLIVGPATIKFSGSINGFYVNDSAAKASATTAVTGGIASVGNNTSAVRNGLLPGFFKIDATTSQGGWDVGAHFGMYPGINSAAWGALGANNGGQPTALATAGIDFRETYLTFGRAGFGEVKIGRAISLYGSDAILNDITLLSSGAPGAGNAAPANTTLGRIGSGYIYADFQPQITYTTPKFSGLQASVGVFQPLASLTTGPQANSSPQFQAKITYDRKIDAVALHLWTSGTTQKHDFVAGGGYTGRGLDVGAKATVGPVTLVGTWYTAKGLGTTVLNLFDTDASGKPRGSNGFYVQGMVTHGKFSVGGSYGASYLDYTDSTDQAANPTLVRENSSAVGQVRYSLNSWMTLIGDYIHSTAKAHNGNQADSDTVALGGILFF